jgi:hypothetical protein
MLGGSPDGPHGPAPASGALPNDLATILIGPARVPAARGAHHTNHGAGDRTSSTARGQPCGDPSCQSDTDALVWLPT